MTKLCAAGVLNFCLAGVVYGQVSSPICERTSQVQEAILSEISVATTTATVCDEVTAEQLAGIETINISESTVTTLQANDFAGLTGLVTLTIQANNDLRSLPATVFGSLTNLQSLDLSDNNLETLPVNIFDNLGGLSYLYLNGNPFDAGLVSGTFDVFGEATEIYLDLTAIQGGLPTLVETDLAQLTTTLDVRDAFIAFKGTHQSTPAGSYQVVVGDEEVVVATIEITDDVHHLTIEALDVGETTITIVANGLLLSGQDLSSAEDEGKQLMRTFAVTVATAGVCDRAQAVVNGIVEAVNASTAVESVTCGQVTDGLLAEIEELTFSGSDATTLEANDFAGLTGLSTLTIEGNDDLETLPADIFSGLNLTVLNLRGNGLRTLPADIFSSSTNLESLDLSDNNLETLPVNIFEELGGLSYLYLNGNPFDAGLASGTFDVFGEATEIYLDLTTVQGALPTLVVANREEIATTLDVRDAFIAFKGTHQSTPAGSYQVVVGDEEVVVATIEITGDAHRLTIEALDVGETTITIVANGLLLPGQDLSFADDEGKQLMRTFAVATAGICDRTPEIVEAIVISINHLGQYSGVTCDRVTAEMLADVSELEIQNGTALRWEVDDFADLDLRFLIMGDNNIEALSADFFAGFSQFSVLRIAGHHNLRALPADMFNLHPLMTQIGITDNFNLRTLPAGIFDPINRLFDLSLRNNNLRTLPDDIFQNITVTSELELDSNPFDDGIPQGIFDPLVEVDEIVLDLAAVQNVLPSQVTFSVEDGQLNTTIDLYDAFIAFRARGNTQGIPAVSYRVMVDAEELVTATATITGDDHTLTIQSFGIFGDAVVTIVANGLDNNGSGLFGVADPDGQEATQRIPIVITSTGVCDRTPDVENLIVDAVNALPAHSGLTCEQITAARLAEIEEFTFSESDVTVLAEDDFAGLSSLRVLEIEENDNLVSLPVGIFDGLNALATLNIEGNPSLRTLSADIFNGPGGLTSLSLSDNDLMALPVDIFDSVPNLTSLSLEHNSLNTLPAGIFDELSALVSLSLADNPLDEGIPQGLFDALDSIAAIYLSLTAVQDTLPTQVRLTTEQLSTTIDVSDAFVAYRGVSNSISASSYSVMVEDEALVEATIEVTGNAHNLTLQALGLGETIVTINGTGLLLPTRFLADAEDEGRVATQELPVIAVDDSRVCERTPEVRDAIVAEVAKILAPAPPVSCDLIILPHLAMITALVIDDTDITALQSNDFAGLIGMTRLAVINNMMLEDLPADVFRDLNSLRTLSLIGNPSLETLPVGIFADLDSLEIIYLFSTGLTALPDGVFSDLTNLSELSMHTNNIETLSADTFRDLTHLIRLNLNDNNIATLPADIFHDLSSLQRLNLSGNQLQTLSADIFSGLGDDMERLLLQGNPFEEGLPAVPFDENGQPTGIFEGLFDSLEIIAVELTAVRDALPAQVELDIDYLSTTLDISNTFISFNGDESSTQNIAPQSYKVIVEDDSVVTASITMTGDTYNLLIDTIGGGQTTVTVVATGLEILGRYPVEFISDPVGKEARQTISVEVVNVAGVCDRTPQVADEIVDEVSATFDLEGVTCDQITIGQLASIDSILISAGAVGSLRPGDFGGLTGLQSLFLSGLNIPTLPEGIFDGLGALETLVLDFNELQTLSADVFDDLVSLEVLLLSFNQLQTLPEGIFDNLIALEFLDLGANNLQVLPADIFEYLVALETLRLNFNEFQALPEGIFRNLAALETLNLAANSLQTLPEDAFSGLAELRLLDLGFNPFVEGLPAGIFNGRFPTLTDITLDLTAIQDVLPEQLELEIEDSTTLSLTDMFIANEGAVTFNAEGEPVFDTAESYEVIIGDESVLSVSVSGHELAISAVGHGQTMITVIGTGGIVAGNERRVMRESTVAVVLGEVTAGFDLSEVTIREGEVVNVSVTLSKLVPGGVTLTFSVSSAGDLEIITNDYLTAADDAGVYMSYMEEALTRRDVIFTAVDDNEFEVTEEIDIDIISAESDFEITLSTTPLTVTIPINDYPLRLENGAQQQQIEMTEGESRSYTLSLGPEIQDYLAMGNEVEATLGIEGGALAINSGEPPSQLVNGSILRFTRQSTELTLELAAIDDEAIENRVVTLSFVADDGTVLTLTVLVMNTIVDASLEVMPASIVMGLSSSTSFTVIPTMTLGIVHTATVTATVQDGSTDVVSFNGQVTTTVSGNEVELNSSAQMSGTKRLQIELEAVDDNGIRYSGLSELGVEVLPGFAFSVSDGYEEISLLLLEEGASRTVTVEVDGLPPGTDQLTVRVEEISDLDGNELLVTDTVTLTEGALSAEVTLEAIDDEEVDSLEQAMLLFSVENHPSLTAGLTVTIYSGICGRTQAIQDAIIAAVPPNTCFEVTQTHLNSITALVVDELSDLRTSDFLGLNNLQQLSLLSGQVGRLPGGLFSELGNLQDLTLTAINGSDTVEFSAAAFAGLTSLQYLDLSATRIIDLPAGIFDNLENLQELILQFNNLERLPGDIYDRLSQLSSLTLELTPIGDIPMQIVEPDVEMTLNVSDKFIWGESGSTEREAYSYQVEGFSSEIVDTSVDDNGIITLTGGEGVGVTTVTVIARLQEDNPYSGYDDGVAVQEFIVTSSICGHNPAVVEAILAAIDPDESMMTMCETIAAQLGTINELEIEDREGVALEEEDIEGLGGLTELVIVNTDLQGLPESFFEELSSLTTLILIDNELDTLPPGVAGGFDQLTVLRLDLAAVEIPDQTLYLGELRLLSLESSFVWGDGGEPLTADTYEIDSVDDVTVIQAEVGSETGILTLHGLQRGTAVVTVRARTDEGQTATQRFTTRVTACGLGDDGEEIAQENCVALTGLMLSDGSGLSPEFDADVVLYSTMINRVISQTTVTVTANHAAAVVTIDPADANAEVDGHQVDLSYEASSVMVTVVGSEGSGTRTYTLMIDRVGEEALPTTAIVVMPTELSIREGGTGDLSVSVNRAGDVPVQVMLTYSVGLSGPGNVLLNAVDVAEAVTVMTDDNDAYEGDRVVTMRLTATGYDPVEVMVRIREDDFDELAITATPSSTEIEIGEELTVIVDITGEVAERQVMLETEVEKGVEVVMPDPSNTAEVVVRGVSAGESSVILTAHGEGYIDAATTFVVTVLPTTAIVVMPSPLDIREGETAALSVSVNRAEGDEPIQVTLTYSAGISGPGNVLLSAAGVATMVSVMAVDDDRYEGDREVTMRLTAPGYDSLEVIVRVDEDELATLVLTVESLNVMIREGQTTELEVSIEGVEGLDEMALDAVAVNAGVSVQVLSNTAVELRGEIAGNSMVILTASGEGYADAAATVTVTVEAAIELNLSATPLSVTLMEDDTTTLEVSIIGVEGDDEVTLTAMAEGDISVEVLSTTQVEVTGITAGSGTATLTASGDGYVEATVQVSVTVEEAPVEPTALSLDVAMDVTLFEGGTTTLEVSIIGVEGDDEATLTATAEGGVAAMVLSTTQVEVTGIAAGSGTITLTASGEGYVAATAEVSVMVLPMLVIDVMPTELTVAEGGTGDLSVSVNRIAGDDSVQIMLTYGRGLSGPSEVTLNAAGEAMTVSVMADDDNVYEGARESSVTLSAAGYESAEAAVQIEENDLASLTIAVAPMSVRLAEGRTTQLEVSIEGVEEGLGEIMLRAAAVNEGVTVLMASTTLVSVRGEFVGLSTVVLTASGTGYADVTTMVSVTVIEGPTIEVSRRVTILEGEMNTLNVALSSTPGNSTEAIQVTVPAGFTVDQNELTFSADSDDFNYYRVPQQIAIGFDNNEYINEESEYTLRLTPSAIGSIFPSARVELEVVDDESTKLTIEPSPIYITEGMSRIVTITATAALPSGSAEANVSVTGAAGISLVDDQGNPVQFLEFSTGSLEQTVTVVAEDNVFIDGERVATFSLSSDVYESISTMIFVSDDDIGMIEITPSSTLTVSEGETTEIEINLAALAEGVAGVNVELTASGDICLLNTSTESCESSLSLASVGLTVVPVTLRIADDNFINDDRSARIEATASGYPSASLDLVIEDDDEGKLAVGFVETMLSDVAEDSTMAITLEITDGEGNRTRIPAGTSATVDIRVPTEDAARLALVDAEGNDVPGLSVIFNPAQSSATLTLKVPENLSLPIVPDEGYEVVIDGITGTAVDTDILAIGQANVLTVTLASRAIIFRIKVFLEGAQ